ncbi:phospho-N-acetylmuramoyl-pentapeptide-transferase [Anaerostipes sp. 494a]|uniref:phospho-N-acetylmuramoyl-pentapeptide- transferase n=1 Tax=Anaerostipes TaxID=207244 RepID=UPI000951AC65|nr:MULTISPECIES: phospho-N-acetylmuramoyl-pentapeptide-transferase [Anaerostipes]MCI5622608.1 phospho-N-acetylmuramoyl-pentapeptide-transferase [Anaerostipes sp.]MDY2726997.1 phospho-N-acetylmuramoyl-pentapeptide-transferase [Anaerostipes faecalis]OLR58697.1 phospho-N-acetylmuramoyl-pentapeptide-transferase [Anaerostipes sp. 494a]
MINWMTGDVLSITAFIGVLVAFVMTCILTSKLNNYLPKDIGRDFAHNGKLSAGKPRGAGIIFVSVFTVAALLFGEISPETVIYLLLVFVEMFTGFMDDAADEPWNEYKKGILDFMVAAVVALNYIHFNGTRIEIATLDIDVVLHPVVFFVLTIILVWGAINVTNCSDGVDGLSGTLTIITLMTIYVVNEVTLKPQGLYSEFSYIILLFVVCILGYLWYNATPSKLMMGDAGSRAMGIFISIAVLKTGSPFLFLLVAAVLIVDGGLGLIKVALLRFLKIHIFKNTTMPLHDHVRKTIGWSNTQTVFRFAIIQIVISIATVYMLII